MPEAAQKKKGITVAKGIEKGEKVADAVKEFTPPAVDGMIDQGVQTAKLAGGIFDMFKSMFKKKKK